MELPHVCKKQTNKKPCKSALLDAPMVEPHNLTNSDTEFESTLIKWSSKTGRHMKEESILCRPYCFPSYDHTVIIRRDYLTVYGFIHYETARHSGSFWTKLMDLWYSLRSDIWKTGYQPVCDKDAGHTGLSFISILLSTSHRLGTENNHCAKTEWNSVELEWWWLGHIIKKQTRKQCHTQQVGQALTRPVEGKKWG